MTAVWACLAVAAAGGGLWLARMIRRARARARERSRAVVRARCLRIAHLITPADERADVALVIARALADELEASR